MAILGSRVLLIYLNVIISYHKNEVPLYSFCPKHEPILGV